MRTSCAKLLVGVAVVVLATTACGSSASPAPSTTPLASIAPSAALSTSAVPAGPAAGTIRVIAQEPTQGLDPNVAIADASRHVMSLIYDTLVDYDQNGQLVGDLAESWSSSADVKTWTFKLRSNAKFSDGSTITASDVKFSIDRMRVGAALKGTLASVVDVAATDAGTVTVTLSSPSRALPLILSRAGSAAILSQAAVTASSNYFVTPATTSGPYTLTSYTPKDKAEFEANPNYWRTGYPKTKDVEYTFSEDQTSYAAAIESGSEDVAQIGYSDAQRLRQAGTIPVEPSDLLEPLFWGWDTTKAPFDSKLVRQAFAYAVDRQGAEDACWFGTGAITGGNILRPWDPDYLAINTYNISRQDALSKAGQLLDQAGWKLGANGMRVAKGVAGVPDGTPLSVTVPYESAWPAAECNTLLLQSTMKTVGVDIKPNKYDEASFWGDAAAGKFTMYHGGAPAANGDDLYLNWFHTGGALTALTTHLNDPSINQQIDAAESTADAATSKQIIQGLEQWQADNLPMLVWGWQFAQVALNPKLKGFYSRPDSYVRWIENATISQ